MKTIEVPAPTLALCGVKAEFASDMTREEVVILMTWCDWQREDLWEGMTLQEILNVYRVSADYDNWEGWEQEDEKAAVAGWNRAVISSGNKIREAA